MPSVNDGMNDRLIKLFSFTNKSGKIQDVKTYYGQNWDELKTDNNTLNSIFKMVDNGDGIVQPKELNLLNKISLYIDSLKKASANNQVLENDELQEFAQQLQSGKISIEQFSETPSREGNWSEGLDRNLSTITLSSARIGKENNPQKLKLKNELIEIGNEQGFTIEEIESANDPWIEDSSIRRADGKIYVPYHSDPELKIDSIESTFISERGNKSKEGGTRVAVNGSSFDINISNSDKFYGTSYLEGGNVLNTISKDGQPSAVVGEGSIGASLNIMGLENTPENVEKVKNQIAEDLNIKRENVTFIPQYDFHIDMLYRPLHNGEFAVPDFDEAIKILTENNIENMSNENKQELISQLEKLKIETQATRVEAEDNLKNSGYKLVKIPCFTTSSTSGTNFMNGIGGTSPKTGQTFYITNKSEYPELQKYIEPYLKNAGIDKVYFVSTTDDLRKMGGIDCLTQEK